MAKASDLIGKSGAGGLGPLPKSGGSPFSTPVEGGKDALKSGQTSKKESKPSKGGGKGKSGGGGGSTISPSVRPKV